MMIDRLTDEELEQASYEVVSREWRLHIWIKRSLLNMKFKVTGHIMALEHKSEEELYNYLEKGYETLEEVYDDYMAGNLTSEEYRILKMKTSNIRFNIGMWEDRLEWMETQLREEEAYISLLKDFLREKPKPKPKYKKKRKKYVRKKLRYYDPRRNLSKNMSPPKPKE